MSASIEAELLLCPAVMHGPCDAELPPRVYDLHVCVEPEGHDAPHECGCSHRWSDRDD